MSDWDDFTLEMMCGESYALYKAICGKHARPEEEWFELEFDDTCADIEANGHEPTTLWSDFAGEDVA